MHDLRRRQIIFLSLLGIATLAIPSAHAGCGCDKPPPPRASVRPFATHAGATVTVFDERLAAGRAYRVEFHGIDGSTDWSEARAHTVRDLADRQRRIALEVSVPPLPLGPAGITIRADDGVVVQLADTEFTVTPEPIALHEYDEAIVQEGYRAAVGRDGTLYLGVEVSAVDAATTFVGGGKGYPLAYVPEDVAIYNEQGFLMQIFSPGDTDLFEIRGGTGGDSDQIEYWRHEFATYKRAHRRDAAKGRGDGPDWHADGSPHVDHDHLVVAIRGVLSDGTQPSPGATPPFELEISSIPAPR